jgi:hypothetical protein
VQIKHAFMEKKYLAPVLFVTLGTAFLITALILTLKGGKSAKWTARKLRLGALLLTLGSLTSCNGGGGEVMCYETVAVDDIEITGAHFGALSLNVDSSRNIEGKIYGINSDAFSYIIRDTSLTKRYAAENIDFGFQQNDSSVAEFQIQLDQEIDTGTYLINFYNMPVADADSAYYIESITLNLKKQ